MTDQLSEWQASMEDVSFDNDEADANTKREPFVVDNLDKAEWAVRKIALAQARIAEVDAVVARRTAALAEWADEATRADRRSIEFFDMLATGYLRSVRDEEAAREVPEERRTKSITVPSGRITSTAGRPSVIVDDEEALVTWLEMERPELVRRSPIKSALTDVAAPSPREDGTFSLVAPGGDVLPGVHLVVGERSYGVKPK